MTAMNRMRSIASGPILSKVLLRPRVRSTAAGIASIRFLRAAFVTTSPARLVAGEILHRGSTQQYVVRSSGIPVVMQHGRDLEALSELFVTEEYEPPAALASRLEGRRLRILDIGANVGMFSAWASGRFIGCQITAFEPSNENLPALRQWAREAESTVDLVAACAMTENGIVRFREGAGAGAHIVGNAEDRSDDVKHDGVDVFPYLSRTDFAKIDIEGGEWSILADPRLADLEQIVIVMEYHRFLAPSLPARQAAVDLLTQAGFDTGFGESNYWGHGTLWAWKG